MAEKTERQYLILTTLAEFLSKAERSLKRPVTYHRGHQCFSTRLLRQPFPELLEVLMGTVFVVIGLMLFVQGLEMGLFPIGEALAVAFTKKGSLVWLLIFGFGLGF